MNYWVTPNEGHNKNTRHADHQHHAGATEPGIFSVGGTDSVAGWTRLVARTKLTTSGSSGSRTRCHLVPELRRKCSAELSSTLFCTILFYLEHTVFYRAANFGLRKTSSAGANLHCLLSHKRCSRQSTSTRAVHEKYYTDVHATCLALCVRYIWCIAPMCVAMSHVL